MHNYVYGESLIQMTTGITNTLVKIIKTPFLEFWREIDINNEQLIGVKITTSSVIEVSSTDALRFVERIINT